MDRLSRRRSVREVKYDKSFFVIYNFNRSTLKEAKSIELHTRVMPGPIELSMEELMMLQKLVRELGGLKELVTLKFYFNDKTCTRLIFCYDD